MFIDVDLKKNRMDIWFKKKKKLEFFKIILKKNKHEV